MLPAGGLGELALLADQQMKTTPAHTRNLFGLWITLAAALAYCVWLGAHWLPLGWSDHELAASASRVWDIKHAWQEHGQLAWWTPNFMSGSSYGLNHARGFYLLPWLLFSMFTSLEIAGKLTVLLAIFLSPVAMYFCARRFLRNEWAAVLAALAFMLHPQQLSRAMAAEHVTISLFFPFIPLLWLTLARALETNRLRDAVWCALAVAGALWTDNKQALVNFVLMMGYLVYWFWPRERRTAWAATAKTFAITGLAVLLLGAVVIVPGFTEQPLVKLFYGDPLRGWQETYSLKSLFALVDRNGVVSTSAREGVLRVVQQRGGLRSQEELDQVRTLVSASQTDSPDKYAGLVWLAVLGVTVLFNGRRQDRRLFWTFIALMLACVALASGVSTVWKANVRMLGAWFGLEGVPATAKLAGALALAVVAAFLWQFWRRKLTSTRKTLVAIGALAVFLFVPAFGLISLLPLFKEIRAPYVFLDGPVAFIAAITLAFFVTDVLDTERWRPHVPKFVMALAALLLVDFWPYERPAFASGVPARTLTNLQATYSALAADRDPVKTYTVTGRYFHLLGPMWSGKPQVYEAFYNWMCPFGMGVLNQQAFASWDLHRTFLNLMGARYIVFDKTDPSAAGMQQMLGMYRQSFPVQLENEDFVVFRNDTARPFVSANTRACLYVGDFRKSAQLALALAANNFTLVHGHATPSQGQYARVYEEGVQAFAPVGGSVPLALQDVQVTRPNHERIWLKLAAPTNCVAIIAESYYPFWRAEVDGSPARVLRVDCGLMGVELPAGKHEVRLNYEHPRSYTVAAVISILALVVCLGCLALGYRRKGTATA